MALEVESAENMEIAAKYYREKNSPEFFPTLKSITMEAINKMKFFPSNLNNLPDELLVKVLRNKICQIHLEKDELLYENTLEDELEEHSKKFRKLSLQETSLIIVFFYL